MRKSLGGFAFAFLTAVAAGNASAVDGVILIDQNKALAGGVTPGDTPGFPVTIARSGSYRLASDLIVPDADTTAIDVTTAAAHVTIDLNGFSIVGPVTCTGSSAGNPVTSCAPVTSAAGLFGPGSGIQAVASHSVTIRNGSVRGMGRHGIAIFSAPRARIEGVTVMDNGAYGIFGGLASIVDNHVEGNLLDGIVFNQGLVRGNNIRRNGGAGIVSTGVGGIINGNNIYRNGGPALQNLTNSPYSYNNLDNNFGGFVSPASSGNNVGGNSCNGGACP
jgi:hypothetical protein